MSDKLALYFGYGSGGHLLRGGHCDTLDPQREFPALPWTVELMDTGLLRNRKVPDQPDGRVHWVCGGFNRIGGPQEFWYGFVWWDRSGDKRGASNSGFYVRGFGPESNADPNFGAKIRTDVGPAFEYACAQWPQVMARQLHPLVLVVENRQQEN